MSLYGEWIAAAYDKSGASVKVFWDKYMPVEQKIYERMIAEKNPLIKGTVAELGEESGMPPAHIVGFLDGIKDALTAELDVENLEETSVIEASVDFETLYKKMVQFKASHLYELPQWENVFSEEERARFYKEQKDSGTVKRESAKIGRNEPCPCGSGKKFKHCCGAA